MTTTDIADDDENHREPTERGDVSPHGSPARASTRRTILTAGTSVAITTLTGCLGDDGDEGDAQSSRVPPLVENRPDAVYVPTHVEGMQMVGMTNPGRYGVALSYSFPHRFWVVTGKNRKRVSLTDDDTVHMMVNLWDSETKTVPPNGTVAVTIDRDGDTVVERSTWPMLSQNMGFHFGDNVALPGEGTYEVTVDVGPVDVRTTGTFQRKFDEAVQTTFSFEYSAERRDRITFRQFPEKQGDRGALSPMKMSMPISQVPKRGSLPGQVVGEARTGDGVYVATRLETPPEGVDGSGPYLAVSARTPYNRYPLPFMSLSATVEDDDETTFDGPLTPTLDPDLDYHYGAVVDGVDQAAELVLRPGAPPQVSRHEGYETAFFDMRDTSVE